MNKKLSQFCVFTLIAIGCLGLSACSDLWGERTTNISFTVDVQEVLSTPSRSSTLSSRSSTFATRQQTPYPDQEFVGRGIASLYYAGDDSSFMSDTQNQTISFEESHNPAFVTSFSFEFDEVPLGSTIYAKVEIEEVYLDESYPLSSFRSENITVQSGVNNLVCKQVRDEGQTPDSGY